MENLKFKEIDLQKQIVQWLNLQGHYVFRTNAGVMFIKGKNGNRCFRCLFKGCLDIIGMLRDTGQFIAIECKLKNGKLSDEQKLFLQKVNELGGIGFVARDLDEVILKLKNF